MRYHGSMMSQPQLQEELRRSRLRLAVLHRLAADEKLAPQKRRAARALERAQKVVVALRQKALLQAASGRQQ